MTKKTLKRCFIITPIGGDRSEIRDALDGLLKNVLEPVLVDLNFREEDITVAHQMTDSGSINTQLITRIIEDELCIVNLTGLNPNVMYELAVRHAIGKPVVIIAEHGTKLPFDIVDQRTIFYHNTMLGAVQLKAALGDMIEKIISTPDQAPDNPILKIIKDNAILDKIKSDGKEHSELSLILNKISNLEDRIISTEKRNMLIGEKNGQSSYKWILTYVGDIDSVSFDDFYIAVKITKMMKLSKDGLRRVKIEFPSSATRVDLENFKIFIEEQDVLIKKISRLGNPI